nr:hypothetical protein [Tanacetum cinerariifolium]
MSWIGLPEFEDDTVTDYSRPLPTIESTSDDVQNRNTSVTKTKPSLSTISPKPFIKFVKATDRAAEKVLIREETKFLVTKNVNSISLTRGEEERSKKTDVTTEDDIEKPTKTETEMPVKEAENKDEPET